MEIEIINHDEIVCDGILSKEEVFKLHEAVRRDGKIDEDDAAKIVNWAVQTRTDAEILKLLLEGSLAVGEWEKDEPQFEFPLDELDFINNLDLDVPMLEESKC